MLPCMLLQIGEGCPSKTTGTSRRRDTILGLATLGTGLDPPAGEEAAVLEAPGTPESGAQG